MELTRRQFIKSASAFIASLALPVGALEGLESLGTAYGSSFDSCQGLAVKRWAEALANEVKVPSYWSKFIGPDGLIITKEIGPKIVFRKWNLQDGNS